VHTVPAGTAPQDVAVDEQAGRVFVLNSYMHNGGQGTVTVLDAQTGQTLRTTHVGALPEAAKLDAPARRVFVLNQNNSLTTETRPYALMDVLDAATGRAVGTIKVGPVANQGLDAATLAVDARRGRLFASVNGPQGSAIDVIDTRRAALLAAIPLSGGGGDAVVSERTGRTFVFANNGRVLVLDTASGRVVRIIRHPIYGRAVTDERTGRIVVAAQQWTGAPVASNWGQTDNGLLSILDARSGALLRTLAIEWPDGLAVDARTGRILISHGGPKRPDGSFVGNGHVDVRDGRDGRLLSAVPVEVAPGAMAVDQRTDRALVVNSGGAVQSVDAWGWVPSALRRHLPLLPPPPAPVRQVPSSVSTIALDR